jgi:hypothetical protein
MVSKKREDVTEMRNCIKNSLLTSIRCLFSCCCIAAVTGVVLAPSAKAAGSDLSATVGKKKFCVIIRPLSPGNRNVDSRPLVQDDSSSSTDVDGPLVSFFKGQVKKVGFGAPKSFAVTQVAAPNLMGNKLSASEAADPAIQDQIRRDANCFFPSLGYYSRTSQNGNQAVALGVGLRGPDPADGGKELPTTPDASVAVMVGFAF